MSSIVSKWLRHYSNAEAAYCALMPDPRPDPRDVVDPAPDDVNPAAPPPELWRNGTPHVERPREPHRIHPDGNVPKEDDDAEDEKPKSKSDKSEQSDRDKRQGKSSGDDGSKDDKQDKSKDSQSKDQKSKDEKDEAEAIPVYKRPIFWIAMVVLVVGIIAGVIYWLHARDYVSTDDAFIESHAVQISPQITARVLRVYVDDNTLVKEGDPLIELDPIDYQVALDQAKGSEAASQGKLEQTKAQVTSSRAALDEAKANLDAANVAFENADRDLKRFEALEERARSKQQFDNAVTAQKNAAANVAQAKAKVASAESQIAVAVANVTGAQGEYDTSIANRRRAEVNLGYTHVVAPAAGRVTTKNVEPGMYATTATPLMAIVRDDVWVVANFKETQLTDMRLNQPVTIKIDAYPDKDYTGKVQSIQAGTGARFSVLPAENATGNFVKVVQRVPVKIVFDEGQSKDPDHLLAPGMSVIPYVKIR
ncbi:MAG: secretion protein HlyD family protein [Phycisphaerales bacterium]|nr:secretion protein HlyD family protein [Phycisphaerales bacterium]